jgi:cytochrome b561
MALLNTETGYGSLSKICHWLVVALFAFQFAAANIMLRLDGGETALGLGQAVYYNWHKSIGLVALVVAVARLLARRSGQLPPWAPMLSAGERKFIHRAEQLLYAAMFVMPVSGFLYVMAGGFGVTLFGVAELPNPIGTWPLLATAAKWTHIASAYALVAALAGHVGLVLWHTLVLRDGLLRRMLPRRGSDPLTPRAGRGN